MAKYEEELRAWSGQDRLWQKLEGKTVMISGATGMIGKCLTDLLMLHGEIRVIALSRNETAARARLGMYFDHSRFRYISCDVNQQIPECGPADIIVHAASNTHPRQYAQDSIGTIASNVFGTKNLLDYGASHGLSRFCFVCSVEVYGENRGDQEKFDEKYLGYLDCNTLRAGYPESKRLRGGLQCGRQGV